MTPATEIASKNQDRVSPVLADRIDSFLHKEQVTIVLGLCVLAAIRIFLFTAAFPIFNYIDEQFHFDTVYEYAKGIPVSKNLPLIEPEVARIIALYETPEYINSPDKARQAHLDIPIEQLPPQLRDFEYHRIFDYWSRQSNSEAQSPPLYYMVAAQWYRLGQFFGAKDRALVYWLRFFNILAYSLFVWVSYLFIREIYPQNNFLCIAVPALLAVFPQDVFFGINREILSPLLAATILWLLFLSLRPNVSSAFFIGAGFLVSLSFLTDISNVVLFGAFAIICCVRLRDVMNSGLPRRALLGITSAMGAALVPALIWMAHNRTVTGDFTGSTAKTAMLGWTIRPWTELRHHPLFSLHGSFYFLKTLMITYWRGENHWHGTSMGLPVPDAFYAVTSYAFLLVFAVYLIRNKSGHSLQRLSGLVCVSLLVLSVSFLAVLSLLFDFHQCVYPSRALPYFVSGRIICGTLLPFALIYSLGFEYLLKRFRSFLHPIIPFAFCCLFVVIAQMIACGGVFLSRFNFFAF